MVYPIFTYESIKERCKRDLTQFQEGTGHTSQLSFDLYPLNDDGVTSELMKQHIEPILTFITEGIGAGKNYVDEISHIDMDLQRELWIARTYLFYQLLLYATATFRSNELYDAVYETQMIYTYRDDIVAELESFKMGIFGSLNPTSDIDLGIQYSGTTLQEPALAYIVAAFESLFFIFTGKSSLAFDIETYADMMTIPNPNPATSQTNPDMFYLNSSHFTAKHFISMLPCAYNSIARNALLAHGNIEAANNALYNRFNDDFKNITERLQPIGSKTIIDTISNRTIFNNALKTMNAFLNMSDDDARKRYYGKVEEAEKSKKNLLTDEKLHDPDRICETMKLIGEALEYRRESYTCAPTVIHVVRILQASKNSLSKYNTNQPMQLCKGEVQYLDPFCSIGYYGFLLSMMEQIGYLHRFDVTYCREAHYDEEKCKKKRDKYQLRNDSAMKYISKITPTNNSSIMRHEPPGAPLKSRRGSFGGKRTKRRSYRKASSIVRKHTRKIKRR